MKKPPSKNAELRDTPRSPRRPAFFLYGVLFLASCAAALWGYAHPLFTVAVMLLALPAAASVYLPYRKFPRPARMILQILFGLGSAMFFLWRLKSGIEPDMAVVEFAAFVGLTLLFSQQLEEGGMALTLSFVLLLYGGLLPRMLYLISFFVALPALLLLLFAGRTASFAGRADLANPSGTWRRNGIFSGIFLLMVLLGAYLVFPFMPTESVESSGIFDVTFMHNKSSMLPENLQKWFKGTKNVQPGGGSEQTQTGRPDTIDMAGKQTVKIKEAGKNVPGQNGDGGSGTPGDRLLFKVKSPLKLYHLTRLYDTYDGQSWSISSTFRDAELRTPENSAEYFYISHTIRQEYIVYNWVSPKLSGAFQLRSITNADNISLPGIRIKAPGAELLSATYPKVPFRYFANSLIVTDKPSQSLPPGLRRAVRWNEHVPRRNFLALPEKMISPRLKNLVRRITQKERDPYKKAILLRDYLRNNFAYEQFSEKVPKGREAVDFFLFEAKKGHCEYFASALCLMARLAGIPARMATGFSPGNYNTLQELFEVYEYHAHAWSQLFFEDLGWLTMDATPPGQIISRTTPAGIGKLRDPFGDEWRITPPERTMQTQKTVEHLFRKAQTENEEGESSRFPEAMLGMLSLKDRISAKLQSLYGQDPRERQYRRYGFHSRHAARPEPASVISFRKLFRPVREFFAGTAEAAAAFFRKQSRLLSMIGGSLMMLCAVAIGICLAAGRRSLKRFWRKSRERAYELRRSDPERSIFHSAQAAQALLALSGSPRELREELPHYVARLRKNKAPGCCRAEAVFLAVYSCCYGHNATPQAALQTLRNLHSLERTLGRK